MLTASANSRHVKEVCATEELRSSDLALLQKVSAKFHAAVHSRHKHRGEIDLSSVTTLEQAYALCGFDGIMPMRERVSIYRKVIDDMQWKLKDLKMQRMHLAAKDQEERMNNVKRQYDDLFRKEEQRRARKEQENLERGTAIIRKRYEATCSERRKSQERIQLEREKELRDLQKREKAELERQIRKLPKPRTRMSSTMLEYVNTEKHLAKLNQYDDAHVMRRMIEKQGPIDKQHFEAEHEKRLQLMRENLQAKHAFRAERLREALNGEDWKLTREIKKDMSTMKLRLKQNSLAMKHAHCLQQQWDPQRTEKPIVAKRRNYEHTSAYYRGTHLLDAEVGERVHAIPSLCNLHDFNSAPLDGTVVSLH
eukprot:g534.t1